MSNAPEKRLEHTDSFATISDANVTTSVFISQSKSKIGSHPLSSLEFSRPWSKQHLPRLHIDESEETFIYVKHSLQPLVQWCYKQW